MLIKQATLREIRNGNVTLAFRRQRRPTVKAGGTLHTSIGVLAIDAVDPIETAEITDAEARAAGHPDRKSLIALLDRQAEGTVYRIALRYAGADPRSTLRESRPTTDQEFAVVLGRLDRWDRASSSGPWTRTALALIAERPGVRAGDLAPDLGLETQAFKRRVRQLKGLGLTESLSIGYRLAPRGSAVLERLNAKGG